MSSLAAGALVAALLTLAGTRDLESYEHAFFSLARGTGVESVQILGHPVYTLAIGLGVRIPLHGNLGASPAAALASVLPDPLTYWMLIALSMGAAMIVVRRALEPLCGGAIAWVANALLFCSVPMVSQTVYNDWPETAVTYCALVGGIFAPFAFLALVRVERTGGRRRAMLGLTALVGSFIAMVHPGYWPLVFGSLGLSMALALLESEHAWRWRLIAVASLTAVALAGGLVHVPDIAREVALQPDLPRDQEGPVGNALLANLFPIAPVGERAPFTFLLLAVTALSVGAITPDRRWRRLIVASSLVSLVLAMAASTLRPLELPLEPSTTWSLRDSAGAFAVLGAALAAAVLRRAREPDAPGAPVRRRRVGLQSGATWIVMVELLMLFALQGPLAAAALVWAAPRPQDLRSWNHNFSRPERRVVQRGVPEQLLEPRSRIALWPGIRAEMRELGRPSTDFADAGYQLVTAWTKNRTMAGLVQPNPWLFDQTTDLGVRALCDPDVVRFLRLRYLVMPPEEKCEGWTALPDVVVDGRWAVAVSAAPDDLVRGVRLADVPEKARTDPAIFGALPLVKSLVAFPGTSLALEASGATLHLSDAARADGVTLVLPVAHDPGWQTSAGRVQDIGGLLAVAEADAPDVRLEFRPDPPLRIRAIGMTVAQILGLLGLVTLGTIGWPARRALQNPAPATASARESAG